MIRVLVVDDEQPARAKLCRLLGGEEDFEVVGEAGDGDEAVSMIRQLAPDLVFLDVRMPRRDGFGVVRAIGAEKMPLTVFVTAFDEHALAAFEAEAVDYLLKPFAPARFHRLLQRIRGLLAQDAPARIAAELDRLLTSLPMSAQPSAHPTGQKVGPAGRATESPKRLLVKAGEQREILLPVEEIDYVQAEGNYLNLHARGEVYRRRATLRSLEAALDPRDFLRINRSEIVRLDAVAELQPWFHGDYRVVLQDGTTLSWSRRYRGRLKDDL